MAQRPPVERMAQCQQGRADHRQRRLGLLIAMNHQACREKGQSSHGQGRRQAATMVLVANPSATALVGMATSSNAVWKPSGMARKNASVGTRTRTAGNARQWARHKADAQIAALSNKRCRVMSTLAFIELAAGLLSRDASMIHCNTTSMSRFQPQRGIASNCKNSLRVTGLSRNSPSIRLLVMVTPGLRMPRVVMH